MREGGKEGMSKCVEHCSSSRETRRGWGSDLVRYPIPTPPLDGEGDLLLHSFPPSLIPSFLSRSEHNFSAHPLVHDFVQRFRGALQRICGVDVRLHLAGEIHLQQRLVVAMIVLGLIAREGAPEHTDDRTTLQERQIERHFRNVARREAYNQKSAIPSGITQ